MNPGAKHSNLQKLVLITVALVAAFALDGRADAGDRVKISPSARGTGNRAAAQLPGSKAPPGSLWYNGDFDGSDGLANEQDTSLGSGQYARVYDDFNVPGPTGWNITAVFSDNLENTNVTGVTWEIRQNVSAFNGGTIVASGMCATPIVVPTGRGGLGYDEFMIECEGVNLCLMPGTYWLNVTPIGDLTGRSFDSTTSGANCIGTPCANNGNSFFDSNFFGANFDPAGNYVSPPDFSMGVIGTADCMRECVPPPGGMISWWPGEGNAHDIIGGILNGTNGTLVGGVTFTTGEVGRAFRFNGRDYVEVPASPALNVPQITIDAWIFANAPGVGTVPRIFSWTADAFEIGDYFNTGRLGVWLPSLGWKDTGFPIRTNSWVHIAVTHDGTTLRVYANGALIPGASYTAPISLNNGPIRFGNRVNCSGVCEAFVGLVDEVELFNRALADTEIQSIYAAGSSGKCKPCAQPPSGYTLWLPFDETSGTTSANLYLAGNNGTQVNIPTVNIGYVDHSLCFNGINQGVKVPNYAAINPGKGPLSIDAWVRRSSESGNKTRVIVDKRTPGSIFGITGYLLALNNGHLLFQLASSGFTNYIDTVGTVPADNQWHFIAVTVNRTSTTGGQFYIDGAPTGIFDPTNRPGNLNNTGSFNVAFSTLSGNGPWLGCIDEVEFFPRVLTQAEITSIYDAGSGGKCKNAVVQGSCAPSSSLCALVSGTNVIAYVPKGCWTNCSTPGVSVVTVEGNITTNVTISTGTDVINSCAANAITGQVVCTANNNMVYILSGTAVVASFPSGAAGSINFSGGQCTNCGVSMDASHNRALIAMSTLTPPVGLIGGFQFLDLTNNTLGNVFASQAPAGGPPFFFANISEDALIDPIRNLLLSANENNNYELVDVAPAPSPQPFYEMTIPNQGFADSSGEDCSTGLALAPYEGSSPSQVFASDLTAAQFTPGPPGSWTSLTCSAVNTLTESFLSAGAAGIAVAQGTHTGILAGEFLNDGITAIALPPTSGVCVFPDWVSCDIGQGWVNGFDPHTVTAYQSPNSGDAIALLANFGATTLAVVDLTKMLNTSFVPRTSGTGLGHACIPAGGSLPPTVVSFISLPP